MLCAQTTKGAQRSLLMALALRCSPDKGYTCWPSYRLLAEDTQLDEITLRRAAKGLEDKGLIRRRQRVNRSNIFILNADLLEQHALEAKVARERRQLALLTDPADISEPGEHASEPETDNIEDELLAAVTGGR